MDVLTVVSCSHFRAPAYFSESILVPHSFYAYQCDLSLIQLPSFRNCLNGSTVALMGEHVDRAYVSDSFSLHKTSSQFNFSPGEFQFCTKFCFYQLLVLICFQVEWCFLFGNILHLSIWKRVYEHRVTSNSPAHLPHDLFWKGVHSFPGNNKIIIIAWDAKHPRDLVCENLISLIVFDVRKLCVISLIIPALHEIMLTQSDNKVVAGRIM